jgi:hypothetical protein
MSEQAGSSGSRPEEGRPVRFEATLHSRPGVAGVAPVDDLDVDRVPDAEGETRVLVDVQDCIRLLDSGFEVRLQRAVPVQPLDSRLVSSEEDTHSWIEQRVRQAGGPA